MPSVSIWPATRASRNWSAARSKQSCSTWATCPAGQEPHHPYGFHSGGPGTGREPDSPQRNPQRHVLSGPRGRKHGGRRRGTTPFPASPSLVENRQIPASEHFHARTVPNLRIQAGLTSLSPHERRTETGTCSRNCFSHARRIHSTTCASARPRWDMEFFTSMGSWAKLCPYPSRHKQGIISKPPFPGQFRQHVPFYRAGKFRQYRVFAGQNHHTAEARGRLVSRRTPAFRNSSSIRRLFRS